MQNVTPKDESVFDEKLSHKDTLPSHTLGIFKHEFGPDGKIKHTWFLRQFSKDEAARKVTYTLAFSKCLSYQSAFKITEQRQATFYVCWWTSVSEFRDIV